MILSIPTRQQDRLALLTQVSARLMDELEKPEIMNPLLTQELTDLTNAYGAALQNLGARQRTKALLALAKATRIKNLVQVLRDFRIVTQRRAKRDPNGERLSHIFAVASQLPTVTQASGHQWLHLAQLVVAAEAEAIRQGFEPSSNPGMADLEALMEGSEHLFAATDEATYLLKEAQIQVADINEEVGPKLRFLGAHLRARYRKQSKSDIRVLMRTYGFTYKSPNPSINHTQEPNQDQNQDQNKPIIYQEPTKAKLTSPVDPVEQNTLNEHVEPVKQSYPKPTTNRDQEPSTGSIKKGACPSASPGSPQPNPPNQRSQKRTRRNRRRNQAPRRAIKERSPPRPTNPQPGHARQAKARPCPANKSQATNATVILAKSKLRRFFNRERHQKRERFLRPNGPP